MMRPVAGPLYSGWWPQVVLAGENVLEVIQHRHNRTEITLFDDLNRLFFRSTIMVNARLVSMQCFMEPISLQRLILSTTNLGELAVLQKCS